ncbi:MAG: transposase [Pseudomonadales bacterium]|nr:transposase [Pseudomonadales bacterium]
MGTVITAVGYVRNQEVELKVYLEDPAVPMATNHIERALRPIHLGRKNWNFLDNSRISDIPRRPPE